MKLTQKVIDDFTIESRIVKFFTDNKNDFYKHNEITNIFNISYDKFKVIYNKYLNKIHSIKKGSVKYYACPEMIKKMKEKIKI